MHYDAGTRLFHGKWRFFPNKLQSHPMPGSSLEAGGFQTLDKILKIDTHQPLPRPRRD
jgi:hypothetical protein